MTRGASVFTAEAEIAAATRAKLAGSGAFAVNLMGSPGAGKTSLILATVAALGPDSVAVIEGDTASDYDAKLIAGSGAAVVQVNTHGGCHLTAGQVSRALDSLDLGERQVLFIENIGNLVCPVGFDLGENTKVAVLSVAEGDDKPYKYPAIFSACSALVVTKTDLLAHTDFDLGRLTKALAPIAASLKVIPLSTRTAEGMEHWLSWLADGRS